jgi:hypothetical protein
MTHIFLSSYGVNSLFNPTDFKVYGSNDDTNWDELLSKTGFSVAAVAGNDGAKLIDADTSTRAYKYFALVITKKVSGTYQYVHVHELRYFGHRVNDLVRFPDSTTVRKFPDTVMASHGPQRGYTASASSEYSTGYQAWKLFDNGSNLESDSWEQGGASYSTSTGYLTSPGTEPTTNGIAGQWVQLELPYTILLSSWSLRPIKHNSLTNVGRDRAPQDGYLFGSTDGSTWSVVENWTDRTSWADGETLTFNVTTSTYYKYFRLVWTRTRPGGSYSAPASANEISFFGTQESTPVLARLGGSFEGKIANTRVYDRSIGERQVLEVWDAEKDRFGRGESSITVHKGRLGVGTKTPQATLDVRGNIFGPLLTHRSYVWRKPGITYVPANQECRILAQVVEIPEMYKNISPLNLRLSYKWQWFGETANDAWKCYWRTNVKHSGDTIEHMNTGMEGNRQIMVAMSLHTGYHSADNSATPEMAVVPGSYELENVTGDTFEIELSFIGLTTTTMYLNRVVAANDSAGYERGCSTLTVFMEPY